jgi:hypothetical protein
MWLVFKNESKYSKNLIQMRYGYRGKRLHYFSTGNEKAQALLRPPSERAGMRNNKGRPSAATYGCLLCTMCLRLCDCKYLKVACQFPKCDRQFTKLSCEFSKCAWQFPKVSSLFPKCDWEFPKCAREKTKMPSEFPRTALQFTKVPTEFTEKYTEFNEISFDPAQDDTKSVIF